MSAITGTEPAHWHDADGRHRMKDPRTIPGWNWENASGDWSDPDERAYMQHLIEHEHGDIAGQPLPEDGPEVRLVLKKIANDHAVIAKQVQLVQVLRQRQRTTTPQEDHDER